MKRIKKLSVILLLLAASLCVIFSGCIMPYHAVLYSHAKEWIDEEFLKENRVRGAYYINEDYVEGVSGWDEDKIYDETSPKDRTFIITEENRFKEIFTKCDLQIDFNKKTAVLYILPDVYPGREYYLKKVSIENANKALNVNYILQYKGDVADATMPYQRCFLLVLDKVEFIEVTFNEVR